MEISCVQFTVEYCRRFGQVAVERGYVTPEQLKEALADQVDDDLSERRHRLLGEILFEKNWMTANQVVAVVDEALGYPAKAWTTAR
jgi:hypothetical protein